MKKQNNFKNICRFPNWKFQQKSSLILLILIIPQSSYIQTLKNFQKLKSFQLQEYFIGYTHTKPLYPLRFRYAKYCSGEYPKNDPSIYTHTSMGSKYPKNMPRLIGQEALPKQTSVSILDTDYSSHKVKKSVEDAKRSYQWLFPDNFNSWCME